MVFKVCFRAWRKCCNSRDADKSKNQKYAHRPPRHAVPEESSTPQVYTTQKPLYESFRSFSEIEDEEISNEDLIEDKDVPNKSAIEDDEVATKKEVPRRRTRRGRTRRRGRKILEEKVSSDDTKKEDEVAKNDEEGSLDVKVEKKPEIQLSDPPKRKRRRRRTRRQASQI